MDPTIAKQPSVDQVDIATASLNVSRAVDFRGFLRRPRDQLGRNGTKQTCSRHLTCCLAIKLAADCRGRRQTWPEGSDATATLIPLCKPIANDKVVQGRLVGKR